MRLRVQIASLFSALVLLLVATGRGQAADQKAVLDKIKSHYQAAAAAYDDGDFDKTKSQLLEVVALSKTGNLSTHKVVAQSYLLFGVLEVAGLKDPDTGIRYFAKALDISPAIQVPPSMATKAVLAAFERAENQPPPPHDASPGTESSDNAASPASEIAETEKPAASGAEKKRSGAEGRDRDKRGREDRDSKLVDELAQAKMSESQAETETAKLQTELQDKDKQLAEMKGRVSQIEKEKQELDKQLADAKSHLQQLDKDKPDKDRQLAEAKGRAAQVEKEKQDQDKVLANTRDAAKKEGEANDKLKKEKLESDRQLADAKARLQQVTKEKQETDQQLAAARESGKREHEANERLEKAKADSDRQLEKTKAESDRQLADTKGRLQQVTKEKQETDRQLAATRDSEKKERDGREKLEKVWQEAQARDKERRNRDEQTKQARDKLAEGPDLPGHFSEPIYCTVPDEIPTGADLFVHCLPHPNVSAKVVALYYRVAGSVVYDATTMERSKKGWYTALIPGTRITGKLLHYYVEARDSRQAVVATNGKSSSPNVATIRSAGAHAH